MTELAPSAPTPPKYSEAWWQEWREKNAFARCRYNETGSRQDKKALRRLEISASFGMAYYLVREIFASLRGRFR